MDDGVKMPEIISPRNRPMFAELCVFWNILLLYFSLNMLGWNFFLLQGAPSCPTMKRWLCFQMRFRTHPPVAFSINTLTQPPKQWFIFLARKIVLARCLFQPYVYSPPPASWHRSPSFASPPIQASVQLGGWEYGANRIAPSDLLQVSWVRWGVGVLQRC